MKLKALFMLLALSLVMCFALTSCGPEESNSQSQSESQSESDSESESTKPSESVQYTVTFHYGIVSFDKEENVVTEYATTKIETTYGTKVPAPSTSKVRVNGYDFDGWSTTEYKQNGISSNLDVYALYTPKAVHTVTFKNFMGSTITTIEVFDGERIPSDKIPATNGYVVYTVDQFNKLEVKDGIVAYPEVDGYYLAEADLDKIAVAVAVPYGMVFDRWLSESEDVTIGTSLDADASFTVQFKGADGIIPRTGAITIDGLKDDSYEYMGSMYKHPISSKVSGVTSSTTDLSISDKLNKYVNKEDIDLDESLTAEEKEAVKAEWQQEYDNYHKSGDLDGRLYMAWDGDYIYFYIEVDDSKVYTEGKDYCSIANPYENDGVEVWYGINSFYSKLCLDAMGFHLYSGANTPSKYLDYLGSNNMYATTIRDGEGNIMTDINFEDGTPRLLAEGPKAGYALEYALPAYAEPTAAIDAENPLGATPGSANWGAKLNTGDVVYFSLQVDCVSAVADENSLAQSVSSGSTKLNSLSTNKAELKRWNGGWQMPKYNASNPGGALQLILG